MAYSFQPYLTLPTNSRNNKFFISTQKGGLSHCIPRNSAGYTLPNCVALVHAEVLETISQAVSLEKAKEIESRLCRNNASAYWGYTQDGLERGQEPRLGAIACWAGGKSGAGHVAFVTAVNGRNWTGRASNYSGSAFYSCSYTYSSRSKYYLGSSYTFQGFIYLPYDFGTYCTEATERDAKVPQIRVNIQNLNVRTGAGTNNARLGFAEPGYYTITGEKTADGYTWYEIQPGKWCASRTGENWVTYLPASGPELFDVTFRVTRGDISGLEAYGKQIQVTPTVKAVK